MPLFGSFYEVALSVKIAVFFILRMCERFQLPLHVTAIQKVHIQNQLNATPASRSTEISLINLLAFSLQSKITARECTRETLLTKLYL